MINLRCILYTDFSAVSDIPSLSAYIEKTYTVKLSVYQCQRLFHTLGLSLVRPRLFPAKEKTTKRNVWNIKKLKELQNDDSEVIEGFKVSESIKSEKYFLYDLRNQTGLKLYDQFLNKYLPIPEVQNFGFEEDVVNKYSADKNIIYLNKPTDIEKFALALADVLPEENSELIQTACENIANYLQPQYHLLNCLRKGIIYHHGSVPDAIRIYIEGLYKKEKAIKYVISSSTLLSGVNLPAERMFILDNRRGRSNLSHDSFKNLVGRVCRFSEIFDSNNGTLKRLEPEMVYVGKWGDVKRPGSNVPRYTRFIGKNRTQVINLAIVRIKEEQDFIDNTLIKYANQELKIREMRAAAMRPKT